MPGYGRGRPSNPDAGKVGAPGSGRMDADERIRRVVECMNDAHKLASRVAVVLESTPEMLSPEVFARLSDARTRAAAAETALIDARNRLRVEVQF